VVCKNSARPFNATDKFITVNYSSSIALVEECLVHAQSGEDKARLLWIRSRVYWARNEFTLALEDTLQALAFLDCHTNRHPSRNDLDAIFEATRSRIMSVGMENILELPRSTSDRVNLIASLLVESSNHAYWISEKRNLFEFLGWKVRHDHSVTIQLADTISKDYRTWIAVRELANFQPFVADRDIRSGMSPSTGVGFLYALACTYSLSMVDSLTVTLHGQILQTGGVFTGSAPHLDNLLCVCLSVSGQIRTNAERLSCSVPSLPGTTVHITRRTDLVFLMPSSMDTLQAIGTSCSLKPYEYTRFDQSCSPFTIFTLVHSVKASNSVLYDRFG
jgi:hypothetical protein